MFLNKATRLKSRVNERRERERKRKRERERERERVKQSEYIRGKNRMLCFFLPLLSSHMNNLSTIIVRVREKYEVCIYRT